MATITLTEGITFTTTHPCPFCDGYGHIGGRILSQRPCKWCDGTGKRTSRERITRVETQPDGAVDVWTETVTDGKEVQ